MKRPLRAPTEWLCQCPRSAQKKFAEKKRRFHSAGFQPERWIRECRGSQPQAVQAAIDKLCVLPFHPIPPPQAATAFAAAG